VTLPAPVHYLRLRSLETRVLAGRSTSLLPDEQLPGDSWAHMIERLSARLGPHKVLQMNACADHRPEHMQVWVAATSDIESIACTAGSTRAAGQKHLHPSANALHAGKDWASALYPTWMLAEPLKLLVYQQRPYYQGALTLLAGPHRLEADWWGAPCGADRQPEPSLAALQAGGSGAGSGGTGPRGNGSAVLRDYFVARSEHSPLLWIFRERLGNSKPSQPSSAWFLHGVFA
jgi:protein ImuB